MKIILGSAIVLVFLTIGVGVYLYRGGKSGKRMSKSLKMNLAVFVPLMLFGVVGLIPDVVYAATTGTTTSSSGLGYIAAALSTGAATIGAGYAVGSVGSSALGAVSEDPKILGKTLIFVGLAEGIAIYGLIISILILGRL
ncbi:MAG: ATPase [Clostridia bacterium]|nr:ATPase [Clostridia bacterium]